MVLISQLYAAELNAQLEQIVTINSGSNESDNKIQTLLEAVFIDKQYYLSETNLFVTLHHPASVIRTQALRTFIDTVKPLEGPISATDEEISIRKTASSLLYDRDSNVAAVAWSVSAAQRILPILTDVELETAIKFCFTFWISNFNHNAQGSMMVLMALLGVLKDAKAFVSLPPSPSWMFLHILKLTKLSPVSSEMSKSIVLLITDLALYFPETSKSTKVALQKDQDPYSCLVDFSAGNCNSIIIKVMKYLILDMKDKENDSNNNATTNEVCSFLLDVAEQTDSRYGNCTKSNREYIVKCVCMLLLSHSRDLEDENTFSILENTLHLLASIGVEDTSSGSAEADDLEEYFANERFHDSSDLNNCIGNAVCACILSTPSEKVATLLATALNAFVSFQSMLSRLISLALSENGSEYHDQTSSEFELKHASQEEYLNMILKRVVSSVETKDNNNDDDGDDDYVVTDDKKYVCKVNELGVARAMYSLSLYLSSLNTKGIQGIWLTPPHPSRSFVFTRKFY